MEIKQEGYILSGPQRKVWDQMQKGNKLYVQGVFKISAPFGYERLTEAIETVITTHDSLRASFFLTKDNAYPLQIVSSASLTGNIGHITDVKEEAIDSVCDAEIEKIMKTHAFSFTIVKTTINNAYLLITLSALGFDSSSLGIICNEITEAYNSCQLEVNNVIQYFQFCEWQKSLFGENNEDAEYFWRAFHKEIPNRTGRIPFEKAGADASGISKCEYRLKNETKILLDRLATFLKVEKSTVLLSCWKLLAYKYHRNELIFVDYRNSKRNYPELDRAVGLLNKIIPVKISVNENSTFRDFINGVDTMVSEMRGWEDYYVPDHSDKPINFGFDCFGIDERKENNLLDPVSVFCNTEEFNIKLLCYNIGNSIQIDLGFGKTVLTQQDARFLLDSYVYILEHALTNPDITLMELMSPGPYELSLIYGYENGIIKPIQKGTLVELFEEQVARTPHHMALSDGKNNVSFKTLNENANRISQYLKYKYNPDRQEIIGVKMDRTLNTISVLLGIMKSGAAFLPLDPSFPVDRINYILNDSNCRFLITDEAADNGLYNSENIILVEEVLNESKSFDKENSAAKTIASDLAYVIFTSGSTGKPKGCKLSHENITNYISWANEYYFNDSETPYNFALFTPLVFDFTLTSIFCPLLKGGCISVYPSNADVSDVLFKIFEEKNGINAVKLTPSHINILEHLSVQKTGIQKLIVGGEALTTRHYEIVRSINEQIEVYNEYGPTEATVGCVVKKISPSDSRVLIGKPIDNTFCIIVNENGNRCGIGVTGELFVGGACVGKGYFDPIITDQRFISYENVPGRVYKTGDLCRWQANGNIEYIGRSDSQVKIKGYRIELNEIEKVLEGMDNISESVAVVTNVAGQSEIALYYVSSAGVQENDIRDFLRQSLPSYMIPAYIIPLNKMPLTNNGKVDKQILQNPIECEDGGQAAYLVTTALEDEILGIAKNIFGRRKLDINDNFFAIGGDSIKAIRFVATLNRTKGLDLRVGHIYEHNTISSLALFISSRHDWNGFSSQDLSFIENFKKEIISKAETSCLLPSNYEDFYPMSDIEKGMVFHYLADVSSNAYHDQSFHQFSDDSFDKDAFFNALQQLVVKHSILRVSFHLNDFKTPIKVVHKFEESMIKISLEDISMLGTESVKRVLAEKIRSDKQTPFNVNEPCLWRLYLYRIAESDYGMLWVTHHSIMDGWSNASFTTELSNVYYSLKKNPGYIVQPLIGSYKDYVELLEVARNSPETKKYWQDNLNNYIRTELPFGQRISDFRGVKEFGCFKFSIPKELAKKVSAYAEETGIGVKQFYLAAFLRLISFISGTQEVLVGVVSNGRPEIEDGDKILGCFLNTLPFRYQFGKNETPSFTCKSVLDKVLDMKKHDRFSMQNIIEAIGHTGASDNPLFDIVFNYNDFHVLNETHSEAVVKRGIVEVKENTNTYFDFSVNASGEIVNIFLNHLSSMYSEEDLTRINNYFINIVRLFVQNGDKELNNTMIIGELESDLLLKKFNDTKAAYPSTTVFRQFEEQCALNPAGLAYEDSRTKVTFWELNRLASVFAEKLIKQNGVTKGEPLIVFGSRTSETLVSILGILKVGAVYIPVDDSSPEELVRHIVSDSKSRHVIASADKTGLLKQLDVNIITQELARESEEGGVSVPYEGSPSDLAYIIYTSGSTGKPKGVMVENRSLLNLCWWHKSVFNLNSKSCVAVYAGIGFDAFTWEIFPALVSGACIKPVPGDVRLDMKKLCAFLNQPEITHAFLPTPVYEQICDVPSLKLKDSLCLLTGGDELHIKRNAASFLVNNYGPTESTVVATSAIIAQGTGAHQLSIGRPINNTRIYILNSDLDILPQGTPGEICIGGDGLSQGYFGDSSLTSEKFVFSEVASSLIYRTGDYGRWLQDGLVEFRGRKDKQVKINGHRIELAEIERTLLLQDSVREAAVIVKQNSENKFLLAYVTGEKPIDVFKLKSDIARILPNTAIPAKFVQIEKMPLTVNGKIDRQKLPPIENLPESDKSSQTTPLLESLTAIWQRILGRDKIRLSDSFFELGGNSILATQLVHDLYKELGVSINIRDIFLYPSILDISELISSISPTKYQSIPIVELAETYELSEAQKRLWILSRFADASVAYNISRSYKLNNINIDRLKKALHMLLERHESLRTTYVIESGIPKQKIIHISQCLSVIKEIDLTQYDYDSDKATSLIKEDASAVFVLESEVPVRIQILKMKNEDLVLGFTIHHIAADAWSLGVLLKDLSQIYSSLSSETTEEQLEPLRIQYKDYSAWHNNMLRQTGLSEARKYWEDHLKLPHSPLDLPLDNPRPLTRTFDGDQVSLNLNRELSLRIKRFNSESDVSSFMFMLTALKVLLYRYSGQNDIIVGTPVSGREHPDLENQVGIYINTIGLRTRFDENINFKELLLQVKDIVLNGFKYQSYPFNRLVEGLDYNKERNRSPFFDVMLLLHQVKSEGKNIGISTFTSADQLSQFDLVFTVVENEKEFGVKIIYNKNLFYRESITKMSESLNSIINEVLIEPNQEIASINLLPDENISISR